MNKSLLGFVLSSCLYFTAINNVSAKLNVFTCEPEWAALVEEVWPDKLRVKSATTAHQDPHAIQARPSLIAKMRNADLLVCTGAGLESGWLPVLLRRAANPRVQAGKPGHFIASHYVAMLEVPKKLDRSLGDIHSQGNPHIHTSPENILLVARALSLRLQYLDRKNANYYKTRYNEFKVYWNSAMDRWYKKIKRISNKKVISQHRTWAYLIDWAGLELVATIEDKPGISPSVKRLNQVLEITQNTRVNYIIYASYLNNQPAQWLGSKTGIKVIELPFTVGSHPKTNSLIDWYELIIKKLTANKSE